MKKNVLLTSLVLGSAMFQGLALAQWDYGQDSIYNGVEARIDIRKTRARMKAKNKNSKRGSRSRRAGRKVARKTVAQKKVATFPHHDISFLRDSYQHFHLDDANGYVVNFNLTPINGKGKPIYRTYNYSYLKHRHAAEYNDIPSATYVVKAVARYKGKKYPVHFATEEGTSTNPKGGNFTSSLRLEVKPAKDGYGDTVIQGFPKTIYTRVVE